MSLAVKWTNPYADTRGRWYKGNLHTHTAPASHCAEVPLAPVVERYVELGYDFLAISDHMTLTAADDPRLVWIHGLEWNSAAGEHTGVYSLGTGILQQAAVLGDHAELLQTVAAATPPALAILNHPNWMLEPHYRREQLQACSRFDGVEIYNHVVERLPGAALATDKWDYLLAGGRRVLGFAADDAHTLADIGGAALLVRAPERSAPAIFDALRRGAFYASAGGLLFDTIQRDDDRIVVAAAAAQELHVIGEGGILLQRVRAAAVAVDLRFVTSRYVRITAFGAGAAMAWTQPFFHE